MTTRQVPQHFWRGAKREQRTWMAGQTEDSDFLRAHIQSGVLDRLADIREPERYVRHVLDVGSGRGRMARALIEEYGESVESITCVESSRELWESDGPHDDRVRWVSSLEEVTGSYSLAVSCIALHWEDDLGRAAALIRGVMEDDSPVVGALLGQGSVPEVAAAAALGQMERRGGVAPRTSPLAGPQDVSRALEGAGLGGVAVDSEALEARYPHGAALLLDMARLGERGALVNGGPPDRQVSEGLPMLLGSTN